MGGDERLALLAIRQLPLEILRINALDKLDSETTNESYLKALVRRAGKIYYDAPNLIKLQSFLNKNPALASSMRDEDRIRMTLVALRQGEVPPQKYCSRQIKIPSIWKR